MKNTGLKKIILINSYIKGLIAELDVERNIMLTGDNGAGKTSMLRLIPAFYGLKTSAIAKKTNERDLSFLDFYLPNKNSYIIFEYYSHLKGICQVVLTRHQTPSSEAKVQFRFINSKFDASQYLKPASDKKFIVREPGEHLEELIESGITYSKAVPTQRDYRRIIQNDNLKSIDREFHSYSLCGGTQNLKHIENIIHSLITGKVNINDLKTLLAKIMNESGDDYTLHFHPDDAERWVELYETVQNFESKQASYLNTLENGKELIEIESELEKNCDLLEPLIKHLQNNFDEQASLQQGVEVELKEVSRERNEVVSEINGDIATQNAERKGLKNQIEAIEDRHADFIDNEIDHKCAMHATIPQLETDLQTQDDNLEYFSKERDELDSVEQEAALRVTSKKADIKAQKQSMTSDLSRIELEQQNAINARESKYQGDNTRLINEFNTQHIEATKQEGLVQAEISKVDISIASIHQDEEVQNLQASVEAGIAKKLEVQEQIEQTQNERHNVNNLVQLNNKKNTLTNKIEELTRQQSRLKEDISKIELVQSGAKGSALSAIREFNEDIDSNPIIKVLSHEILVRTDLDPSIDKIDLDAGIMGLKINVDKLPIPKEYQDLDQQQITLDEQLESVEAELDSIRLELNRTEDLISKCNVALQQLERKLNELQAKLDEAESHILFCKDKRDQLIQDKSKILLSEKQNLEKALQKAQKSSKDILSLKEEKSQELSSTFLTDKCDIESEFAEKHEACKIAYQDRICGLENDIEAIRKDADDRINDIDFDHEAYRQAKRDKEAIEEKIEEYTSYGRLIEQYMLFKSTMLPQLDELRSQVNELDSGILQNTQKKDAFEFEINNRKQKLIARRDKLQRQIDMTDESLSIAKKLKANLDTAGFYLKDGEPHGVDSTEDFLSEISGLFTKSQKLTKKVRAGIASIQAELVSNGTEEIRKLWNDYVNRSGELNTRKQYQAQIRAFEDIVTNIIPTFKSNVITNVTTLGHNINDFKDQLTGISRDINALGKRISNAVNGCSHYKSISNIQVNLESVIHKVHGWETIVEFCETYKKWVDEDYPKNRLPSELFKSQLKEIIAIKRNKSAETRLEDLFNVVFSVTENNRQKTARTATDLERMSSNGLTFLFISTLYLGLIKVQRGAGLVSIHWPVDELGKLSTENTLRLIGVLEENQITLCTALPEPNTDIMYSFNRLYHIGSDGLVENKIESDELALLLEESK
ncbi:ATP-binding protein [Vibrio owensii]|uniref:ATP-binding protein n=1 Tax=Vibrio owensii TaxID=696485 RepID=UPI003CC6A177